MTHIYHLAVVAGPSANNAVCYRSSRHTITLELIVTTPNTRNTPTTFSKTI